ncbi:LANO_0E13366g1_1 [Lachancea nothofagi CBS 11611]|uniref:mRNA 3'-end-processing protein RNA14 n=1 Tax=Lachancea nothofagi CBS 11611 TaxID=1266666 RepID=A0A1G4JZ69_9SACH|nr:LANO_0E13366g1_1 [Lachancea nothofagi CBS 11611]
MSATPELAKNSSGAFVRPSKRQSRPDDDVRGRLEDSIEESPSDICTYLELVKLLHDQEQPQDARQVLDKLHERFPLFAPLWTAELSYDLERDEFEYAEALLTRSLSGTLENNDLGLWFMYLDFVRRKNNIITGGEEARSVVLKAFDAVATKCASWEPRSSTFWTEYLSFLEHWKPVSKWEEQQRVDLTRTLYKRMLCIPFDGLERSWNKYTQWEQEVNSLTARKFIGELSANYMKARSLYQEWTNVTKGLRRVLPSRFSQCSRQTIPQPGEYEVEQLHLWTDWIRWELENKLDLSESQHAQRVDYVYKQSVQHLLFSPEIWYNYSMFTNVSSTVKSSEILAQGLKASPGSCTLAFKLAEHYELQHEVDQMQRCFEECLDHLVLQYHILSDDNRDTYSKRQKITFVYSIYMNAMKRVSGLSSARKVFGKCRKLKDLLTHEIYVENAYLEFHNQNDHKTACKVLELGMKYFADNGEYVNKYLDFLILINQDGLIKTLFETSIDKVVDTDELQIFYKKVINYESKFGNLSSAYSIESRFFEKFPQLEKIEVFTDRYQIQNNNLIKKLELNYLYKAELPADSFVTGQKRTRELSSADESKNSKKQKSQDFISDKVIELLKVLPKRQYFKTAVLDAEKLTRYLSENVSIPSSTEQK